MIEGLPYTLAFTIDGLPLLPNNLQYKHWSKVRDHAKLWHWLVRKEVGREMPPKPLELSVVTLQRNSSNEPDEDGLMASWKPVIDGLIHARVIVDDKPINLRLISRWERTPRPRKGFIGVSVVEI